MNKKTIWTASQYKLLHPSRYQMEINFDCLDSLLPADHKARNIWEFIELMDCSPCFEIYKTFMGHDGRPAISPKILLALWIYSILDGNLSARKIEELCKNHNAYRWIAGGVSVNRTTLSKFRTMNSFLFEDLLTNTLAVLLKAGLINDTDFAQDGTRIKANAGFNSYRRKQSLEEIKVDVKEYIDQLKKQENSNENNDKNKLIRIAEDRLRRVEEALEILDKERELKQENGKRNHDAPTDKDLEKMRASTTDPVARKMKMGDGGFRLAYNVQLATGMTSRVIFGVDVVTTLDPGTSPKMMAKVHSRLKKLNMNSPKNWFADSAYSSKRDIEAVAELFPNCRYYAPPKVNKKIDPKKYLKNDSKAIKEWRDLIDQEDVEELYKLRCSTAEFSNAQMKQRGWREFFVRGIDKVRSSAILNVIAQNISRAFDLQRKLQTV